MWTFITKLARSLFSDLCKQHSIRLPIEPYGIYIIRHFHIIALCVCNGLDLRKHSNSIARKKSNITICDNSIAGGGPIKFL